jgi:NADH-quinone oxidoreductase subunit E
VTVSCVQALVAERTDLSREQLIPLLQEVQAREGFVSQAAMSELATALDTPVAGVYGVATFYNQFRFAPLGEHVIEVCRGTACHVKQSLALAQHLQHRLKLRPDGNSADGRFSVIKVACLGACSIAPSSNWMGSSTVT